MIQLMTILFAVSGANAFPQFLMGQAKLAHTQKAQDGTCVNIAGNWKGICPGTDAGSTYTSEVKIEQTNCSQMRINGEVVYIGGVKSESVAMGGGTNISSTIAAKWNSEKTKVELDGSVLSKDMKSEMTYGLALRASLESVDTKLVLKMTSAGVGITGNDSVCTYEKE